MAQEEQVIRWLFVKALLGCCQGAARCIFSEGGVLRKVCFFSSKMQDLRCISQSPQNNTARNSIWVREQEEEEEEELELESLSFLSLVVPGGTRHP